MVEQVIMEHQDQDQLEQPHHVEQVELEVKLTVQQVQQGLLIEVVEEVELVVLTIKVTII